MDPIRLLITQVYEAFNRRDIDAALTLLSETVDWPKASEGGRVIGKAQIRAYWLRQWGEFDPHVEPMEIINLEGHQTKVKVHQIVKDLHGHILSEQDVWHLFTISSGFIERMDVREDKPSFK